MISQLKKKQWQEYKECKVKWDTLTNRLSTLADTVKLNITSSSISEKCEKTFYAQYLLTAWKNSLQRDILDEYKQETKLLLSCHKQKSKAIWQAEKHH